MSLPFLNTAPGFDEVLRNSVFFERGLHATSICGAVGAAVAVAMLQGQDEAGVASPPGSAARLGARLLEGKPTRGGQNGGYIRLGAPSRRSRGRPRPRSRPRPHLPAAG